MQNAEPMTTFSIAYRNVESFGLFGYEHKVLNFETRSAAVANHLSAFDQVDLKNFNRITKFIPQVLWL